MGPQDFNAPFPPEQKPRLGVGLAAPSEELQNRFHNKTETGAFVMTVVPGSPAEQGGINVGDAIIAFNSKEIKTPEDLMAAVQSAPKGRNEVTVLRHGQSLVLAIELDTGIETGAAPGTGLHEQGPWLRRGAPTGPTAPSQKYSSSSHTEVKASALELSDELAQTLKLTDEQRKKMSDILVKENQKLSEEVAQSGETTSGNSGGLVFRFGGDLSGLVSQHVANAEKSLANVLSAEQMKQWQDYRKTHNSTSVSQSTIVQEGDGTGETSEGDTGL